MADIKRAILGADILHTLASQLASNVALYWLQNIDYMLDLGILCPSSSSWFTPLHMVPKRMPGDWRLCGDFHVLNKVTTPDRYSVPHVQDFTANLCGVPYLPSLI